MGRASIAWLHNNLPSKVLASHSIMMLQFVMLVYGACPQKRCLCNLRKSAVHARLSSAAKKRSWATCFATVPKGAVLTIMLCRYAAAMNRHGLSPKLQPLFKQVFS